MQCRELWLGESLCSARAHSVLKARHPFSCLRYLVVTCNYAARAAGCTKLMATAQAKAHCPELVLISGEDLTPYRAASKQVLSVLQRYGPAEALGLDEVFVDVTEV